MNDKVGLLQSQKDDSEPQIVNALVVSGTRIGDAGDPQTLDHVLSLECAVEGAHLNPENGPIADLCLSHESIADAYIGESLPHGLRVRPGREGPCL